MLWTAATLLLLGKTTAIKHNPSPVLPEPVSFWRFQEPAGSPRTASGQHQYNLTDGDGSHPVERSRNGSGLFGPFALNMTAASRTQRLRADRKDVRVGRHLCAVMRVALALGTCHSVTQS